MRNPRNDPALASSPATAGAQGDAKQRSRAPGSQPAPGHIPERTCILTRRKAGKSDLIRLALSPDGKVAPGQPFFTIWRRESLTAPWRYIAE